MMRVMGMAEESKVARQQVSKREHESTIKLNVDVRPVRVVRMMRVMWMVRVRPICHKVKRGKLVLG